MREFWSAATITPMTSAFWATLQSSFPLAGPVRTAGLLKETFSRSASDHSLPPDPLRVLPAGARVSRPGFSPGRKVHLYQGTHNNAAERALRAVALGRKNYLFAGSDNGGERAAALYTLIGTAKLNDRNPEAYLRYVLEAHRRSSHQPHS